MFFRHAARRPRVRFAMMAGGALVLSGCASGLTQYGAPPSAAPVASAASAVTDGAADGATAAIIKDFAFGPQTLRIAVGTTVRWTNQDLVAHTVTADDGSFDSGTLQFKQDFEQTFGSTGTFSYLCTIHPSMVATVVVEG